MSFEYHFECLEKFFANKSYTIAFTKNFKHNVDSITVINNFMTYMPLSKVIIKPKKLYLPAKLEKSVPGTDYTTVVGFNIVDSEEENFIESTTKNVLPYEYNKYYYEIIDKVLSTINNY